MEVQVDFKGFDELKRAILRNPDKTRQEVGSFLVRGMAVLNRGIIRNPWEVGSSGGGAPVATGNLRDTHTRQINTWDAYIQATAPYASFVHEGTKKMQSRPWLDDAVENSTNELKDLEEKMVENIVVDLAR